MGVPLSHRSISVADLLQEPNPTQPQSLENNAATFINNGD